RAVDHRDADLSRRVGSGGHLEDAERFLPARRRGGADGDRRLRVLRARAAAEPQHQACRPYRVFHVGNFTTVRATEYSWRLPSVKDYALYINGDFVEPEASER